MKKLSEYDIMVGRSTKLSKSMLKDALEMIDLCRKDLEPTDEQIERLKELLDRWAPWDVYQSIYG